METNPFTHKSLFRSSGGKLLTDQYSGAFMNGIKQSVLLTGLQVALDIAYAVGTKAQEEGLAPACEHQLLRKKLTESQWFPEYTNYEL